MTGKYSHRQGNGKDVRKREREGRRKLNIRAGERPDFDKDAWDAVFNK